MPEINCKTQALTVAQGLKFPIQKEGCIKGWCVCTSVIGVGVNEKSKSPGKFFISSSAWEPSH